MGIFDWLFGKKKAESTVAVMQQPLDQKTFEIVDGGRAIRCLHCQKTSYHTEDIQQLYCGFCHQFHKRPRWS